MPRSAADRTTRAATLDALERDEEAFLLEANDWHPELIEPLAPEAGLPLSEERLEIIRYIRDYFEANFSVPEARTVLKHMEKVWGKERFCQISGPSTGPHPVRRGGRRSGGLQKLRQDPETPHMQESALRQ
jgi:TusE/DsrC/DsvC family sulfur relay protein